MRVKEEIARNRQLEQQQRDRSKQDANKVREMFEQQKLDRDQVLRHERAAQVWVGGCGRGCRETRCVEKIGGERWEKRCWLRGLERDCRQ